MTRRWAESDLRFLRDNFDKMDVQALADRLGARIEDVEIRLEKLGVKASETVQSKKLSSMREMFKHSEAARKEYEKGVAALQKKKFEEAEKHFRVLLEEFGDERELADRARLYLTVCEKRKKPARPGPAEGDDPYYAALVEKNRGNYEAAIEQLKKSSKKNGDGRVAFLLACCYSRMNDVENALDQLKRAIAEDETNRIRAARDSDFDGVREGPEFQKLTAASA